MNLTFALVLLVGIGGASICSIRLGQQDIDGATRVLGNVLLLGLCLLYTSGLRKACSPLWDTTMGRSSSNG